ncbi:type VI secretion system protein ImpL [Oxalobacteraceae bacterium GrIS 1.11]
MMRKIWQCVTESRALTVLALVALALGLYLLTLALEVAALWALPVFALALALWAGLWYRRRLRARHNDDGLDQAIVGGAAAPGAELDTLRASLLKAIATIKTSKLGQVAGAAALYELPWYMIIGNPAAGKSSAVLNSGLQFPFADAKIVQGVGGTRNCDWFFTTDGILLDTAGRYSVLDQDRAEWFGFLDLLKKYRKKVPINGILIAVSVAELRGDDPDTGMTLARSLRKRVQDVIERLEVFAPLYIVFTKADLIAGFMEFFGEAERGERDRVWGATMPYQRKVGGAELLAFFDQSFDELHDGLTEMSLVNMAHRRRDKMPPGVFTFPLEFADIKIALRAFIATLFEENPYQFQPVFRGYYFTSALQEGEPVSASFKHIAQRFDLRSRTLTAPASGRQYGFFLLELFRQVIFADKDLVSYFASKNKVRLKYAVFFGATLTLGACLGAWSWSYLGNRQLVGNVQADLEQVVKLQAGRPDLQSRLEALEIIEDRIEQLEKYRAGRPWSLHFGLYQGDVLERKLREEYFSGVKEVMLKPVLGNIEALLTDMNAHPEQLQPASRASAASAAPRQFQEASATNVEDAYNALKTYLMLVDKSHAEASHLNDQMTRFWRGWLESKRGAMPRERMIRSAERLMTFYLDQVGDPSWPRVEQKLALVDQARDNLRRVVRGMPARERVYADIKARAATRFPSMTVARIVGAPDQALVAGSYAIAGTFTRQAWEKFVEGAIRDAANHELQSADWVLKSASKDDLTLEGSPEQIQKGLLELYKADYTREWQKFVQGLTIGDLNGFDGAVLAMNRLGDPLSSPIAKLLLAIYQETSWDNPGSGPGFVSAEPGKAEGGFINWLKAGIAPRAPVTVSLNLPAEQARGMGPVGREFAGLGKLVAGKDSSLLHAYMETLSKVRSRLNQLKNQGDAGPGAKQFMQQTLEGNGSELADALKFVDEQMLVGMSDAQKQAIRPILVRPLMQTFAVIVLPTEAEINKTWSAQVYQPFQQSLANKYPFAPAARIEASNAEISQFFGPDGVIAKFVASAMGPLVVRRGDMLAARTWADMGITLAPQVVTRFPGWIAALGAGAGASAPAAAQTVFQIQPMAAPGTLEYTVEIDGQQLRYRNTPAQWTNMVHPGVQGAPGARITAVTFDGRSVELLNEPGQFGLKRMIDAASKTRKDGGVYELRWNKEGVSVAFDLKITSSADVTGSGDAPLPAQGLRGLKLPETIVGRAEPASGVLK